MADIPKTHKAVASPAPRARLIEIDVPTILPQEGEVLVHVEWTASTPLDLHEADGGLLCTYPQLLGDGMAGTVVAIGKGVSTLNVGDQVAGFAFAKPEHKAHQEYATVPAYHVFKIPQSIPPQAAVTVPNNLVTAFHAITKDLELKLPWPRPNGWSPPDAGTPILIWGAASSVGMYSIQVLRHWGYNNIFAVASGKHHDHLRNLGAEATFDYRKSDVIHEILSYAGPKGDGPRVPLILDCIGSVSGTLEPLTKIAESGSKVAIMLPLVVRHASEEESPIYEMDVKKAHIGKWVEGVILRGVRTHFYTDNEFFKNHLQPDIVPALLEEGVVQPNKQRIIEGKTMLERAQRALDLLRKRAPSGERLVWRVAD